LPVGGPAEHPTRAQGSEVDHPTPQLLEELAARLDRGHGLTDVARLLLRQLDGGRQLPQLVHSFPQLGHGRSHGVEPGTGFGMALPGLRDLGVGELGVLEGILHQGM